MSTEDPTMLGVLRAVIYVLPPLSTLLLAAPIVVGVLPWELHTREFHSEFWVIGIAAGLGAIATPGYVAALFQPFRLETWSAGQRWWIAVSLMLALLASLVAVPCTLLLAWPLTILPIATCGFCVELLARSARAWRGAVISDGAARSPDDA